MDDANRSGKQNLNNMGMKISRSWKKSRAGLLERFFDNQVGSVVEKMRFSINFVLLIQ